jgi:anti-sigma-K factor RskA
VITPEVGQGTVAYAASCNAVTLDVTGLPDLPSDQAYQLWAVQGQTPRSLGLLEDASQGQPQLVTATTNAGESVVAITAEPAAGSPQPTSQIIWQTTLDA